MSSGLSPSDHIYLRGVPCPLNFVRCRLAIERLGPNHYLQVDLDRGDPEEMVIPGLEKAGHNVKVIHTESNWMSLIVDCASR